MPLTTTLPEWLAEAIHALQDGDTDGWMKLYASDAVHEFPFAPEGSVSRLEGRESIANYMRRLPGFIRFGLLSDVLVHEAGDEVIIEAVGHHHRVADGAPRDLRYVWFITRQNGEVTHIRDYMNPLQLTNL